MTFPSRNTHPQLIKSQVLSGSQAAALRELSAEIEIVVRSEEFERLVKLYGWNTAYGHCAVASCALQVLAWVAHSVYVDTYNAVCPADAQFSHWFVRDPTGELLLDPTRYQFDARENGSDELVQFYEVAVRKGHPSRRKKAPYYTNSPPVTYVIEVVSSRLGFADAFQNNKSLS